LNINTRDPSGSRTEHLATVSANQTAEVGGGKRLLPSNEYRADEPGETGRRSAIGQGLMATLRDFRPGYKSAVFSHFGLHWNATFPPKRWPFPGTAQCCHHGSFSGFSGPLSSSLTSLTSLLRVTSPCTNSGKF